jgi:hypothetical protein
MISSQEFLAEPRYDYLIIQSPNAIEPRWRSELQIDGNMYAGYGENGHIALCAVIQRFRETNPDSPGIETMTINMDRELIDGKKELK